MASRSVFSRSSLSFGNQGVGTSSAAQVVTLTNTGTATLTITSIAASGDFSQTNTCGASVAPAANCTISVIFNPTSEEPTTELNTPAHNASRLPLTDTLTATGTT